MIKRILIFSGFLLSLLIVSCEKNKDVEPWSDIKPQVELKLEKTQFDKKGGESQFIVITNPEINNIYILKDGDSNWYSLTTSNLDKNKGLEYRRVILSVYENTTNKDRLGKVLILEKESNQLVSSFEIYQSK